jgi:hypothetical protein
LAKLDGSFKSVAVAAAGVHRQWRAAARVQSLTNVEERLQIEKWMQASVQLQRELNLVHSSTIGPDAGLTEGTLPPSGVLEVHMRMTVQTPLLAAKLRAWQQLPGVRCYGLCAAVRFPREAELVLKGAVSSPFLSSHIAPLV